MKTGRLSVRALPALLGLPLVLIAGAAQAADVYALTPQEKAAALQSGAAAHRDGAGLSGGGALPIHGEFGAMIGTGGMRSAYGTAAIPIGQDGGAIISFESSRYGQTRR